MKEIFRNNNMVVIINPHTQEVFIKNLISTSGIELRIGVNGHSFSLTAYHCQFIPTSFNGLPGFIIKS